MKYRLIRLILVVLFTLSCSFCGKIDKAQQLRLDKLDAEIARGEDISAIKKLQRAYGYYVDKGMWEDLAALFTDDAIGNYPNGVYIGKDSLRKHFFMNVGGGKIGDIGLGDNRLYNHLNLQPVVHLDHGGQTAKGRWRAFAMIGRYGERGYANWADGVYEITYAKDNGVWKIKTLDYHSGFGASYTTGWGYINPDTPRSARRPRTLPHPADQKRNMPCEGFPAACIAPFHYGNPGTSTGGLVWTATDDFSMETDVSPAKSSDAKQRLSDLTHRATLLQDELEIENLQRIYGYYQDRRLWDQVADLFTHDGTIEIGLRGVYVGKERIRKFLNLLGPDGLSDGHLYDHVQLQPIVSVAPDGLTAKARCREFGMTGVYKSHGYWSEGVYENTYVKDDGVWKIKSLRFFPTFITDYDKGWGKDAQPAPTASIEFPPDRPPTEMYEIYPKFHIPPFHYNNPVTGSEPHYPKEVGRPTNEAIQAVLSSIGMESGESKGPDKIDDLDAALTEAENKIQRVKDHYELENLENAYGYYLDKSLWTDLSNLFAKDGSMELAQRGVYKGRDRVYGFLTNVFGKEGPVENRLGNHVHMQPVIHVSSDGKTAKIRSRMMQQMSFRGRSSMGASVYENEAIKEDGVWKYIVVHTYNTWTASYNGGWAQKPGTRVPGQSETYPPDSPPTLIFNMFPTVYDIPFHYRNPVSGR